MTNYQTVSCATDRFAFGLIVLLLSSCHSPQSRRASIEFTDIPEGAPGGAARTEKIAGRVTGAKAGQQVVLFARSGTWWVQPFASKPFTAIQPDSTWKTVSHMGTEYAALLVEPGYSPPKVADVLPAQGGGVLAVAIVPGKPSAASTTLAPKTIHFSGYEWEVYQAPADHFGVMQANRASNAWTDQNGWQSGMACGKAASGFSAKCVSNRSSRVLRRSGAPTSSCSASTSGTSESRSNSRGD